MALAHDQIQKRPPLRRPMRRRMLFNITKEDSPVVPIDGNQGITISPPTPLLLPILSPPQAEVIIQEISLVDPSLLVVMGIPILIQREKMETIPIPLDESRDLVSVTIVA